MRPDHTPFTRTRKIKYAAKLAELGRPADAAAIVGVGMSTVNRHIREDEAFAELVAEAREQFAASVEAEIKRRAMEGVDEPVFNRGEVVGHVTRFSDRLLLALAKKHDPGFRDYVKVDQNTNVSGGVAVGLEGLGALSAEHRALLRRIIEERAASEDQASPGEAEGVQDADVRDPDTEL